MQLDRIDLNLFVVLDAIFSEGGITRASEKLHLTQPAVSHALNRLRRLFDDPLFVREGRALVPTPLARGLIEPVRAALRALEVSLSESSRFDPASMRRRFTIGVRDVLEARLLPPLLRRIAAEAPNVDIAAVRADRRELEAELARGTLDAAVDMLLPLSDAVRRRRVVADALVVVARADHPRAVAPLTLETYLQLDHVLTSSRRSGQTLEDAELSRHGLQRRIRLRCQHYFSACRVVSQTDLVLTMPESYARIASRQWSHQLLPFPLPTPTLDAVLYWHEQMESDPANRWLRERLLETFAE
jgi:DNA-binding transcriptional LysR family regulator